MRKILLILMAAFVAVGAYAKDNQVPEEIKQKLLSEIKNNGSTLGTEFILGFTPNDDQSLAFQALAMYVAAPEETRVRLSTTTGFVREAVVPANDILLFSAPTVTQEPLSTAYENWQYNRPVGDKALIVESDKPVSIYVLSSKNVSSEGYLGIPTSAWGKKYIHCSYWDFGEFAASRDWGGGFQIIAKEDDTKVTINFKGKGLEVGNLMDGGPIPDGPVRITLDRGELYQAQGDGQTRGVVDLSGTDISSNKPIGVISYHVRTMVPKFVVGSGRDHMVAMMPPVQAWGKRYASVEMQRGTGQGDYFRVVSAADNNQVEFTWFDMDTKEVTNSIKVTLGANEVWSPFDVDADQNTNPKVYGVNGVMLAESSEPMFVMQYSYSAFWDGAGGNYDPFMFPVTAVEQYTYATLFQTPKNNAGSQEYNDNYFNLLYVGDTTDAGKNQELANSIILDGVPLPQWDAKAPIQRIPQTNIFYALIPKIEQGVHRIYGDAPFGGYIYGFGNFESYGWPAATNYMNLDERDPWAPVVEWENECDVFYFDVTDKKPAVTIEDTTFVDVGLTRRAFVIEDETFNFLTEDEDVVAVTIDTREESGYSDGTNVAEYSWRYQVADPYQDAKITLRYQDAWLYPNDTTVTAEYIADKISFTEEDDLAYGKNRVGVPVTRRFEIAIENENIDDFSGFTGNPAYLAKGEVFTVDVQPMEGNILPVDITYLPIEEFPDLNEDPRHENLPEQFDYDTLFVETECLSWAYEMTGQGVLPRLLVRDFPAETPNPGEVVFYEDGDNYPLVNSGTMTTTITGISEIYILDIDKVRVSANLLDGMPALTKWSEVKTYIPEYTVTPIDGDDFSGVEIIGRLENGGDPGMYPVGTLEFMSDVTGTFNYELVFENNADAKGRVDNAYWTATVNNSNIEVTDLVWPMVRLESYNDGMNGEARTAPIQDVDGNDVETNGFVMLTNSGSAGLRVYRVELTDNEEGHFEFDINYGADSENRWTNSPAGTEKMLWNHFPKLFEDDNIINNYVLDSLSVNTAYIPLIFNPKDIAGQDVANGQPLRATVNIWGTEQPSQIDSELNPLILLGTASLEGSAFLPEITVTDVVFPNPAKEGEYSDYEEAQITITTDYDVKDLTVFGLVDNGGTIFAGANAADFGLANFGDITNPTDNVYDTPLMDFTANGTALAAGGEITMSVYFRPEENGDTDRFANFTVLSDAKMSDDDPNNRAEFNVDNVLNQTQAAQETPANVTALAFTTGGSGVLVFENETGNGTETSTTTKCDPLIGTIILTKSDDSSTLFLGTVEPVLEFTLTNPALDAANFPQLNAAFVIQNYAGPYELTDADPNLILNLQFSPELLPEELRNEEIVISVIAGYEFDGTDGTREQAQFPINDWAITFTMTDMVLTIPELGLTEPGQIPPLDIRATSPDWVGADVTQMSFKLLFNNKMFFMTDKDAAFDNNYLPAGWEYTDKPEPVATPDPDISEITVTVNSTGGTAWPNDANIFNPQFMVLIHDAWTKEVARFRSNEYADGGDIYIDQASIDTDDRTECIYTTEVTGGFPTKYCSPQNHNVKFGSNKPGAMAPISPNPVTGNSFDLDYTVQVGGHVQISLIDATGRVVAVPLSKHIGSGEYVNSIDTENLGSGVYQLMLVTPTLKLTQPVNIIK